MPVGVRLMAAEEQDVVPGRVEGLSTIVATWHDSSVVFFAQSSPSVRVPSSPSSKVMNTTVFPD